MKERKLKEEGIKERKLLPVTEVIVGPRRFFLKCLNADLSEVEAK